MFYSKVFQSSTRRCFSSKSIVLSEKVKQALSNHEPLVALESTIITHGKNLIGKSATLNKIGLLGANSP